MFFTNRQNSASRLNKSNKRKQERKMSLYYYEREKKRKEEHARARERAFFSRRRLHWMRSNRMGQVFRYSANFTRNTSKLRTQTQREKKIINSSFNTKHSGAQSLDEFVTRRWLLSGRCRLGFRSKGCFSSNFVFLILFDLHFALSTVRSCRPFWPFAT